MSKLTDQLWGDIRDELNAVRAELRLQRAFAVDENARGVRVRLAGSTSPGIERIPRLYDGMDITPGAEVIIGNIGGGRVILGAVRDQVLDINSMQMARDYISSRSSQQVANYTGQLLSNYNFPQMTFDPTELMYGWGSFRDDPPPGGRNAIRSAETIAVDPERTYELSAWAKASIANSRCYIGIIAIDMDGNEINLTHFARTPNTLTTLATTVNPGDTSIKVASAANWSVSATASLRGIVFYGYQSALGFTYPDGSYSRRTLYPGYEIAGLNTSTGVITLTNPIPDSWEPIPAGTAVANANAGGAQYIAASNVILPTTWTRYAGQIGGYVDDGVFNTNKFPTGTAGIKIYLLPNYNNIDAKTWFNAVSFRQVS